MLATAALLPLPAGAADTWTKMVGNNVAPLGDGFGAGGVLNTNNTVIQSLNAYNGFLYAAVETVSNQPTIWRSSDLINWTNVVPHFFVNMRNIFDMQSNTNGIFFGTGYGGSPTGAQVWKSTDGINWFAFSGPANGLYETNFNVMVSLQGGKLYAGIGPPTTNGSAEVWERPADGSANWTKLLDFNTGLGSADGVLTNVGLSFIYAPPGAANAVFLPCNNSATSNCWIYETADGGATWHKNAAAGTGFGDSSNPYISSMIEFNGYLYVGTGNPSEGAQMWRTPLTNAVNWSSTNAWQQVASGGLVNKSNGEFHRFAVGGGKLWIYLAASGPKAQVWCSDDGTNWIQSNVDGFGIAANSMVGSVASFTSTNGNNYMVCGDEWINPTNSKINAAQVWATQITSGFAPAITNQPQSVSTNIGANVSFIVGASGDAPLNYQWRMNAANIFSATNATLALNNVQTTNAGGYDVIVSNGEGSVTSLVATLSVSPVINTNTPPLAGIAGTNYSQTLAASGGAPPYTWSLVGGALPGGLTLSSAGQISGAPGASGTFNFTVQITDAVGQIATGALNIVVTDPWVKVVGNNIVPLGDGFGAGGVLNTNNDVGGPLNQYNGFLYAGIGTVSNHPSVWRSSDMINWTHVPFTFSFFMRNIGDMQSNTNGIFFGSGYGGSPTGAQIWKSTDGLNWFVFSTPASGFYETNTSVGISLQGNALYAAIPNPTLGATEVWKRPADGSTNWTKVLDFNTGLGCPGGPQPISISYIYGPPGATNAVFLPSFDATGCWIYETADGGTTWHKNAAMADGFGDTNNYIASMIEFNGYLYAGTGNPNGAQIWRKPLADAVNWSSTNAWQQVATGGLGNIGTEFHRFAVAGGELWTLFAAHGPKEKVWRSADGTNWVQSNVDGFGTSDYAGANCLASFTSTSGNNYVVWSGPWTNPNNSNSSAAQIWQLGPIVSNPSLQIQCTNALLQLSWPVGALGFGLETSTNLLAPVWTAATYSTSLNSNQNLVTFPVQPGSGFYRLHQH